MDQDEQTPRSPSEYEHEPTRRISLFQEFEEDERTRRLEIPPTPPWDASDPDPEPRGAHGTHIEHSPRRWLTAVVAGVIGLILGVVATLLVTGAMLQREIADRDTRIAQLTSELDQARAEQRSVEAQRDQLDRREAALDARERRVPLPGLDLPDGLGSDALGRLGQRIQDLLNEVFPSQPSP